MSAPDQPLVRHQALVLDQLADERTKKSSLEQRGVAVISTSGTLVTITLGFATLAAHSEPGDLPTAVVIPLTLAVSGLIAASIAGLILNLPVRTVMIDDGWLAQITERADWDHVGRDSARDEFRGYVDLLVSLRTVNRRRARVLVVALLLEVGALALLAVGAVVALVT